MWTPECGRPPGAFYCSVTPGQACMGRLHGPQQPGSGTRSLGSLYSGGDLVASAHALGLQVHAYTLRNEVLPLPLSTPAMPVRCAAARRTGQLPCNACHHSAVAAVLDQLSC